MIEVGFMQGRLSPIVDGRIQSFPWGCWQDEFRLASSYGFHLMEWTLDHENLYENPLLTKVGRDEILALCQKFNFRVSSLTGDCFMQVPFWKASGEDRKALKGDFLAIAEACSKIGISIIVVPLVDNGSLENDEQEKILIDFLVNNTDIWRAQKLKIIFESDFEPEKLASFIDKLDPEYFGINYDIGNSASLGFNPEKEMAAYGDRILNVHIKDRKYMGTTVPLGEGDAQFEKLFRLFSEANYSGNYILQAARAGDGDHIGVLKHYRDLVVSWIERNET
jgi:hexulose-6-phosphate isomerase